MFAICNVLLIVKLRFAKHAFLRHISYPHIRNDYCRILAKLIFNHHETEHYIMIIYNVK